MNYFAIHLKTINGVTIPFLLYRLSTLYVDTTERKLIFISYSSKQTDPVQKIKRAIDGHLGNRYTTWMAIENMVGPPSTAMGVNVRDASLVILCLSSSYEQSEYCRAEAHLAMRFKKKRLVLVMEDKYDPMKNPTLSPILAEPRSFKCYNDELINSSIEKILLEIEQALGKRSAAFHNCRLYTFKRC